MKKKILLASLGVVAMGLLLAGCGSVTYNVIGTDKTYEYELRGMSGATPDAGITIDGKMDDSAYKGLKKLTLQKNYQNQTSEIEITTLIGKSGLYLGAEVEESTKVFYNPTRNSAYNTCVEFYFGFGDGNARGQGIFEVDLSAGGQFSIRVMQKGSWSKFGYGYEEAPLYAMKMAEDENGDCHEWSAEAFIPYSVFGRTTRPSNVYFTIAHNTPEKMDGLNRLSYNFAFRQAGYSYATEMDPTSYPYVCDRNGYRYENITFDKIGGGTLKEEHDYTRALLNRKTNIVVQPDEGNALKSFTVNGVDSKDDVKNGVYSCVCKGELVIEAEFTQITELNSATVSLSGKKNGVSVTIDDGELKLIDGAGKEKKFTVTNGVATVTDVFTNNYEAYVGNDWYGRIFFENGKTSYDLVLGYMFCDVTLTAGASANFAKVSENAIIVSGVWIDHDPSIVTLRLPEETNGDYTLTTTVRLSDFQDNHTNRLSIAVSGEGNVFSIYSRGMWMIGHGMKRDLDQDNGEEKGALADKVGAALLNEGGLQLTITRTGDDVTVSAVIDDNATRLDSFKVSGDSSIQFMIGAGTWTFSDVTVQ